jgi:hypothetical protein
MFQKEILLESGEEILLRSRLHPGLMLGGGLIVLYSLVIVILTGQMANLIYTGFGFLLFVIGLFRWSYREFIVTNKRLLMLSGYYYIRTKEYPIKKIDNVSLWQNQIDRFWDRGVVTLFGIGIRTRKIRGIAGATRFKNAIHSQLSVEPDHYFD